MINKQELLAKLEKERSYAVENNMLIMAFGIAQSIKIVEQSEEIK